MVLLNEGLTKVASVLGTEVTKGQWGTATTEPSASDTGLSKPVAATLLDLTASSSGSSVQFTHELSSATGNGNTLTEFELRFADGTSLNRSLGGAVAKDATIELVTISTINVQSS